MTEGRKDVWFRLIKHIMVSNFKHYKISKKLPFFFVLRDFLFLILKQVLWMMMSCGSTKAVFFIKSAQKQSISDQKPDLFVFLFPFICFLFCSIFYQHSFHSNLSTFLVWTTFDLLCDTERWIKLISHSFVIRWSGKCGSKWPHMRRAFCFFLFHMFW